MFDSIGKASLVALSAEPLSVPLREPFVVATARMDTTRAALVRVTLRTADGNTAEGMGEAAALPPITDEDQPDIVRTIESASRALMGRVVGSAESMGHALDATFGARKVARAGAETAILDALARLRGVPLASLLSANASVTRMMETDITLPIAAPSHMAKNAVHWRAEGFRYFKVKVGREWTLDREALRAVHDAVPDARFRLDANEGFSASEAIALIDDALTAGLVIECFEQPCRRDDVTGMAQVARATNVPVVADESLRNASDLEAILRARAARGVNLKLVKLGGPLSALAIGKRAKAEGLGIMAGAMVETRLGLTAMAHVVAALDGVDWVDLDTALLLDGDPFEGGLSNDGCQAQLSDGPGLDIRLRT
jgi:L-alanine-DL-glutamate epimerase-like enolase superfamily enzyme